MSDRSSKPGVTTLFWLNVASGPADMSNRISMPGKRSKDAAKNTASTKHGEAPSKFEKQTPLLAEHNLGSTPSTSGLGWLSAPPQKSSNADPAADSAADPGHAHR